MCRFTNAGVSGRTNPVLQAVIVGNSAGIARGILNVRENKIGMSEFPGAQNGYLGALSALVATMEVMTERGVSDQSVSIFTLNNVQRACNRLSQLIQNARQLGEGEDQESLKEKVLVAFAEGKSSEMSEDEAELWERFYDLQEEFYDLQIRSVYSRQVLDQWKQDLEQAQKNGTQNSATNRFKSRMIKLIEETWNRIPQVDLGEAQVIDNVDSLF